MCVCGRVCVCWVAKQRMASVLLLVIGSQFTPEPINKYFKHIVCRRWIILNGQSVHNLNFHLSFFNTFQEWTCKSLCLSPFGLVPLTSCTFSLSLSLLLLFIFEELSGSFCGYNAIFPLSLTTTPCFPSCYTETTEIFLTFYKPSIMPLWVLATHAQPLRSGNSISLCLHHSSENKNEMERA